MKIAFIAHRTHKVKPKENKTRIPKDCAGYLTHPSVLWNFKHEFRQSTPIFPSTKMSLKDHFQENTLFTDAKYNPISFPGHQ